MKGMKRIKIAPLFSFLIPLNFLNACAYKTQFCSAFQIKIHYLIAMTCLFIWTYPFPGISYSLFETTAAVLTMENIDNPPQSFFDLRPIF